MSNFNTIEFKFGFEFRGRRYGFYEKNLYRLPFINGMRHYPMRIIPKISVGNLPGYRCCREKISINKIKALLKNVDWKEKVFREDKLPF